MPFHKCCKFRRLQACLLIPLPLKEALPCLSDLVLCFSLSLSKLLNNLLGCIVRGFLFSSEWCSCQKRPLNCFLCLLHPQRCLLCQSDTLSTIELLVTLCKLSLAF